MAGSLNKVQLIGRLGADPEIKQMVNGKSVARISIATSQSWKDRNTGEKKEKTEWHRVVVFGVQAKWIRDDQEGRYTKGAAIFVMGSIQTRKWQDQSGEDRYSTEIVVRWPGDQCDILCGMVHPSGKGETPLQAGGSPQFDPAKGTKELDDEIPF